MVGILDPAGNGACLISVLNGEVVVDGATSVFLAASFLRLTLSSLISSFMGETIERSSILLEVAALPPDECACLHFCFDQVGRKHCETV